MSSYSYGGNFVLNVASNMQMRIYGGPDATSETLARVRGGSVVKDMGATRNGWRYVSYKDSSGVEHFGFMYDGNAVEGGYLRETTASVNSTQSPNRVSVDTSSPYHVSGTNSCLWLRPRATKSGDRGCFTNGTNVYKTGRSRNGFSEVRLADGRTGWMGSRYLSRGLSQTEASAPCIDCQTQRASTTTTDRITVGSGAFANYHTKPQVAGMIAACRRRFEGARSQDYCLRGVRLSGQESGLFRSDVNLTAWGSTAGDALRRQGFINLLNDSSYDISGPNDPDIPAGAVLVYDGRNGPRGTTVPLGSGIGHAEIKTGDGTYCSDYTTTTPGGSGAIRSGMQGGTGRRTRRLKGVWVKPGL